MPPGGAPLPVRLLGEDLVLFRDEQGQPGLLGLHCPHRGADLSYGRLEDGGLRCLYHGWLFDCAGRCLEQPGEPAGSTFNQRIRHPAYPCREAGAFILAYLGPGEPPLLPAYEFLHAPDAACSGRSSTPRVQLPAGQRGRTSIRQHLSFLHRQSPGERGVVERTCPAARPRRNPCSAATWRPRIEIEETDFGVRIYSVRQTTPPRRYVRITNFVLPNLSAVPGRDRGRRLPGPLARADRRHPPLEVRDHLQRSAPLDKDWLRQTVAIALEPDGRLRRNPANRYQQDREEHADRAASRHRHNDFQAHDAFATESQGPVQDRTQERLGSTDRAIALARQMMLRAIRDVQEGRDPPHVIRAANANRLEHLVVKSEALPRSADWKTYWRQPAAAQPAGHATS